ncbi:hypothetical protein DAPK24_004030 [Pichia kluyveri]|uniref:Protein RMD9-like, mitochondrial n=1 Tax=Pichia kluyveri TaxID=36015 RepID=A0AAV5QYI1_PICKL|nr:hypothetical protein DAPK24_004030 [Pichia kluyveri]
MLRSLTNQASTGLKQGQRVSSKSSKSFTQHQSQPQPSTQTQSNYFSSNAPLNTTNTTTTTSSSTSTGTNTTSKSKFFSSAVINAQPFELHQTQPYITNNNLNNLNNFSNNNTDHIQLALFDECLKQNSTYDLATGKISGGGVNQFWLAIKKIIPIYRSLIYSNQLNEKRMADFVSLLRNGLRIHRLELSKLNKNLDKDSNNPIKNIHYLLTCAIREVSYNLLDGLIYLNPHGLTHLFKAYKDLGFTYEAVHIWETGKNLNHLKNLFTSEPVLGSIFPFLVESGDFNFDEIWQMYLNIKLNKKINEKLHNELQIGMIRVCLFKNKNNDALTIFKQLTSDVYNSFNLKGIEPPINIKSYMTMAHLSFIGFCKDIKTADYFFMNAVNESMPYLTPLQLNFIKKYISNSWEITNDFEKIKKIWLITWNHYELKNSSNSSVSSSLNDAFLSIFFQKYPNFNNESFNELKLIINDYSLIRSIDEPFINVLLSKSTIWHNSEVFEYILNVANSNPFMKTNVFYRCCLKACGSVDLDSNSILSLFRQLLSNNASNGMKFIAHADWVALRDATINSPFLLNFNSINDRIDLYFKLWKICSSSFINLENFKNYILKDIKLNFNYSKIFQQMSNIKSDIEIPEINYFIKNKSIQNYISNGYALN